MKVSIELDIANISNVMIETMGHNSLIELAKTFRDQIVQCESIGGSSEHLEPHSAPVAPVVEPVPLEEVPNMYAHLEGKSKEEVLRGVMMPSPLMKRLAEEEKKPKAERKTKIQSTRSVSKNKHRNTLPKVPYFGVNPSSSIKYVGRVNSKDSNGKRTFKDTGSMSDPIECALAVDALKEQLGLIPVNGFNRDLFPEVGDRYLLNETA